MSQCPQQSSSSPGTRPDLSCPSPSPAMEHRSRARRTRWTPSSGPRDAMATNYSAAAGLSFAAPTPGSVTSQPPPPEHVSSFHSRGQPRASTVMAVGLLFPASSESISECEDSFDYIGSSSSWIRSSSKRDLRQDDHFPGYRYYHCHASFLVSITMSRCRPLVCQASQNAMISL